MKKLLSYFSTKEWILWLGSLTAIIISFLVFDSSNVLTLIASLIGITSLIFAAKGNPIGPFLMIIFSVIYGIISYSFCYYGEMITYLGMTLPMAVISLVAWLKNPFDNSKSEVKVNKIKSKEYCFLAILTIIVTIIFYFILKHFNTANLYPSTLSVTTSFVAVYLTFRRSPYYAIWYAMNDIILIVLWVLASKENTSYISVVVCFAIFLINDLYGYYNWKRIEKRQRTQIMNGE